MSHPLAWMPVCMQPSTTSVRCAKKRFLKWLKNKVFHLFSVIVLTVAFTANCISSFSFRTLWICVPENKSSTRCSSPSASFMPVLQSDVNLAHKGGTTTTPSAQETSPSQPMCCTTTWRPTLRYFYHYFFEAIFIFNSHSTNILAKLLICFYDYLRSRVNL